MQEEDIDILGIDTKIQNMFISDTKELQKEEKILEELKITYENKNLSPKTRTELEKSIRTVSEKIDRIRNNNELEFYLADTAELLEKYKNILKTPQKLSFIGKPKVDDTEKFRIMKEYIQKIQKYYHIDFKQPEKKCPVECNNCGNKKDFIIDENSYICQECYSQQEMLQNMVTYRDSDRVNITTRYTYDRKVHFRDCINQYQGKQNCTIHQNVYNDLEDIFDRHHLLLGDKNTPKEIRFSKISKEHILMFLKELGHTKHYENVNLIHYTMTGKKPDDISHLEDRLLSDFDLLLETYDKRFKNKVDRVNFISTQFVLYQLLLRHKHPCKKEDFVILKTTDRKSFHDDICGELFAQLNFSFHPVL